MQAKRPPADRMILDARRLDELPSRWPKRDGWRKEHHLAKWNAAVDQMAVPAWDMIATYRMGSGVADTYSIEDLSMYLSSNGFIYCAPWRPTPAGTCAEWRTYLRSADEVPGIWHPEWGTSSMAVDHREEVATGFANLVARHELPGFEP